METFPLCIYLLNTETFPLCIYLLNTETEKIKLDETVLLFLGSNEAEPALSVVLHIVAINLISLLFREDTTPEIHIEKRCFAYLRHKL